jgi:tetraacyldisaccharide 4'-kinase
VALIRNKCFDIGIYQSKEFDLPIIAVGNLSTGGTGKTPMVEYLVRLLRRQYFLAILSRGYKRKTQGFVLADAASSFETIGDEPFQYHSKFKEVQVAVDEKRVRGIQQLLALKRPPKVIILDDAFQHRYVKPGLNILLTAYNQPFYKDICLPTGNLREPRAGKKRADIIIITKCPEGLTDKTKSTIKQQLKPHQHQSIFFSTVSYAEEVKGLKNSIKKLKDLEPFTLLTGIAKPGPMIAYLDSLGLKFDTMIYPDHHNFKDQDITELQAKGRILTTEKDFTRLVSTDLVKTNEVYYLTIEFTLDRPEEFARLIANFLKREL